MTGVVRWRNDRYGFITRDDGADFFFHCSKVVGDVDVEEGDRVTFDEDEARPGRARSASNVARDFS